MKFSREKIRMLNVQNFFYHISSENHGTINCAVVCVPVALFLILKLILPLAIEVLKV